MPCRVVGRTDLERHPRFRSTCGAAPAFGRLQTFDVAPRTLPPAEPPLQAWGSVAPLGRTGGSVAPMTTSDVLRQLEALGHESVRTRNRRRGAGDAQLGVKLGDIRKLGKALDRDPVLAMELWATGILDARMLAILLLRPKDLSVEHVDAMVRTPGFEAVADWLDAYVARKHPEKEQLRVAWMADHEPWAARAGWSLTAERIAKHAEGLDLSALLDRIERELSTVAAEPRWTMNHALAAIGIHHADYRERAVAIGEALGVYRDYPVPKGCTSPFAPLWIAEMVRRNA